MLARRDSLVTFTSLLRGALGQRWPDWQATRLSLLTNSPVFDFGSMFAVYREAWAEKKHLHRVAGSTTSSIASQGNSSKHAVSKQHKIIYLSDG